MPRRTKGEGTIFWSSSESTWIAEITLPDGRKKKKRSKDKQVVKNWLLEYRQSIKDNRVTLDDNTTFSMLTERFLEDVGRHTLRPKTLSIYEYILRNHVVGEIGKLRLTAIKPYHLQSLYSKKLGEGLSKKTVFHIHATIRRVLNEAVKWGLIYSNPCSQVTPPKVDKLPPRVWSIEEAQKFLSSVLEHRWYSIYLIALTTGARRGEILGMEWQNIDWDRGTISILKTISEIDNKIVISQPKTQRSRRTITLPQVVLDSLKKTKGVSGFIFQTSAGTPVAPRNLVRHFHEASDSIGLPKIRFHDLRHTAATILLQKDVHPKLVQELLGHSSITLTLDTYSHVIAGVSTVTADRMDEVFKP
ncbi:MAG: tyrosine-type recombinase/integrase [Chloroflexota bacterium]